MSFIVKHSLSRNRFLRGVVVEGTTVTILSGGTYIISGTLTDGQIVVKTVDNEVVKLVLSGAETNCSTSAPIYVKEAENAVIILADGTENYISDGYSYIIDDPGSDELPIL